MPVEAVSIFHHIYSLYLVIMTIDFDWELMVDLYINYHIYCIRLTLNLTAQDR